jgi:hypothetical protein
VVKVSTESGLAYEDSITSFKRGLPHGYSEIALEYFIQHGIKNDF